MYVCVYIYIYIYIHIYIYIYISHNLLKGYNMATKTKQTHRNVHSCGLRQLGVVRCAPCLRCPTTWGAYYITSYHVHSTLV